MPRRSLLPAPIHRFVDTGLVRIHVAEVPGPGRALLLLHGIGMDWRVWQAISRRLHPYFHLYMLDLRGHGESEKPATGYSIADYAGDIEDVIEQLGITGVVLVGSSLGGLVALAVEAPPDIVSFKILADPPLTGGEVPDQEMFHEILRLKHCAPSELADYLRRFNPGSSRFFLETIAQMWNRAADGVLEDMLTRPHNYNALDDILRAEQAPTLVLRADPDLGGVLTGAQARRAVSLMQRGYEVEVTGAGHAIHAEKPEDFVRLVLEFTRGKIDGERVVF